MGPSLIVPRPSPLSCSVVPSGGGGWWPRWYAGRTPPFLRSDPVLSDLLAMRATAGEQTALILAVAIWSLVVGFCAETTRRCCRCSRFSGGRNGSWLPRAWSLSTGPRLEHARRRAERVVTPQSVVAFHRPALGTREATGGTDRGSPERGRFPPARAWNTRGDARNGSWLPRAWSLSTGPRLEHARRRAERIVAPQRVVAAAKRYPPAGQTFATVSDPALATVGVAGLAEDRYSRRVSGSTGHGLPVRRRGYRRWFLRCGFAASVILDRGFCSRHTYMLLAANKPGRCSQG